jgi:lipoprotein-anchoring transpeptidase ErfK/SrfK
MLEVALIVVSLSAQSLTAIDSNGQELARMVVSTGKPSTPTPIGTFEIGHQYSVTDLVGDDYRVPDVPHVQCLVGNGITPNNYCIHPQPPGSGSLGIARSRGCIRLANQDAKWLFDNTAVGTEVIIHG